MRDDGDHKGPEEVLMDYLSSESPEDWLVNEVCGYLFDEVPMGEIDDRLNTFDELIAAERERLLDGGPELDDVVLYTVTVDHGDDTEEFLSFRDCPSPALLMEACVHMAEPGELVRVDMVYGDASHSTATLVWPFPMNVAVEVTTALRRDLDEDGLAFLEFISSQEDGDGAGPGASDHTGPDDLGPDGTGAHLDSQADGDTPGTDTGAVPLRVGEGAVGPFEGPDTAVVAAAAATGALVGVLTGLAAARRLLGVLAPRRR